VPKAGFLIPYIPPEHRSFCRDLPEGARQGCRVFSEGAGKPLRKTLDKSEKRRTQRYVGGLLTRAIQALALRAPLASKPAPGRFVFGYFLLATHKFVWNEFEQPIGWPAGRKPWMVFVAQLSRLSVREQTSAWFRAALLIQINQLVIIQLLTQIESC